MTTVTVAFATVVPDLPALSAAERALMAEWLTRSLDLQRRLNPHVTPARTLAQLGSAHVELARARRDHGDLDAAAVHAARAVEVLREAGNPDALNRAIADLTP